MSASCTESPAEFDGFALPYDRLLHDPLRSRFAADSSHFLRRKWLVLETVLRRLGMRPKSMTWLDMGCGRGEFLNIAGPHFLTATGCDPSRQMLARSGAFATHVQTELCRLPFASQSFDLVTAICVYHHVNPKLRGRVTEEVRRVLRPQGLFCLIEHNPYNPITQRIVRSCPIDAAAELLTAGDSKRLLKQAGMRPVRQEFFLYLPEKWFRRFRVCEALMRKVPFGGQYVVVGRNSNVVGANDQWSV